MSPSDSLKPSRGVAAIIEVMFWPFIWAAAQVKALGEWLRKLVASAPKS
jgi:hypothetical protein